MSAPVVGRGLAAALAVAGELGLPTGTPRVLSARGNLVVALEPAPVVARVATLTAWSRGDPTAWARREVRVAAHAARQGADVLVPVAGLDPGPHVVDDLPVTLWARAAVTRRRPTPAVVGVALATLHAALSAAPVPGDPLPWLTPVHEQVTDALATVERRSLLDARTIVALRRRHAEAVDGIDAVVAAGAPVGVLHGDAHAGNLVGVEPLRWSWTDFEETSRGPFAWDLAVLAAGVGGHGAPSALAAWADAAGAEVPDAATLRPFAAARRIEAAVWLVAMADVHPQRYARLAPRAVTDALSSPDPTHPDG